MCMNTLRRLAESCEPLMGAREKREKDDSRMNSTDTQTNVESCTERNCKVQQRVGDESFYVNLRTFHGAESI